MGGGALYAPPPPVGVILRPPSSARVSQVRPEKASVRLSSDRYDPIVHEGRHGHETRTAARTRGTGSGHGVDESDGICRPMMSEDPGLFVSRLTALQERAGGQEPGGMCTTLSHEQLSKASRRGVCVWGGGGG